MTINRKLILLFAVCIFIGGGIGSYKSFQLYKEQSLATNISKSEESSQWISQSVLQKIKQLESAVSYLDKSTIETLRRFGARYFAYAFKDQKNEWSIKWKKLGSMGKEEILGEVEALSFEKFSTKKRNWTTLKSGEIVFVSPVGLAESHQLKTGFLVFGLNKNFFEFVNQARNQTALVTEELETILAQQDLSEMMILESLKTAQSDFIHRSIETEENFNLETAYFAEEAQLWIVKKASGPAYSFVGSSFFTYFIISSLISLLAFILALSSKMVKKGNLKDSLQTVRFPSLARFRREQREEDDDFEDPIMDDNVHIQNFGEFVEGIIEEEALRLRKLGIKIKTQMEEDAKVYCSPKHISDLLKRLIGNSVLVLEKEEEKEIQIQLVEQNNSFQLIYVDTRTSQFPSQEAIPVFGQTEASMEGIDGIIAYAQWFYGERLTLAKKGFCLSVDLMKEEATKTNEEKRNQAEPVEPLSERLDRIEINDIDTDQNLFGSNYNASASKETPKEIEAEFTDQKSASKTSGTDSHTDEIGELEIDNLEPVKLSGDKEAEEPAVSFDKVIEEFRLKELSFKENEKEQQSSENKEPKLSFHNVEEEEADDAETLAQDEKGLYEIKSGQFKLKIRAPKKKDTDVHS